MNKNNLTTVINSNGRSGVGVTDSHKSEGAIPASVDFLEPRKVDPIDLRKRIDTRITVEDGLRTDGWKRGEDSGDVEPNPVTIESLKAYARAAAEDSFRENFDPTNSLHDKSRHEQCEKDKAEMQEAKLALQNEKSKLKEGVNLALKAKRNVPTYPEFPIALVVVGVPLITLTVAFALYDSFVGSLGFILALTFSLLAGLCWGAFVCFLILHKYHDETKERDWMGWLGLIAGVGMALALGLIRFSQSSPEFFWLVLGLTTLEIFIVIGLEFFARRYRQAICNHSAKAEIANEAQSYADSIREEIDSRKERVDSLQNKIEDHLHYLEARERLAKQKELRMAAAETAIVDGYLGAVAKNKGMLLK